MMQLSIVSVPVSDQERAKAFYRDVLGFQVVREAEMEANPARRWIQMKPPSGLAGISLVTWFEAMPPGSLQGLVLDTSDIDRAQERLKASGLDITPVQEAAWGRFSTFRDPDGNGWVLVTSYHR
jgi:catechol 2,3-dioxygenase-like lactoylglutathione lyase family enzyme